MKILQHKKLYLPAFSIVAVVFILLVFISISTYRNLDREKRKAMSFVHRQGLTLLRSIEAGARTGMIMHMQQEDTVESLIREVAKTKTLLIYTYLIGKVELFITPTSPVKGRCPPGIPGALKRAGFTAV